MNIKTIEIAGLEASFKAMRLPMRSGDKSDSEYNKGYTFGNSEYHNYNNCYFGPNDLNLAKKLIKAGDEHSKFLRGINVWMEINAPWYFFNELDTYVVGCTSLGSTSSMHTECKGLTGDALQAAKGAIRGDYEYTRIKMYSYQTLQRMYFQRKSHRLPEWKVMCEYIKSLPLAEELIICE